LLVAELHLLMAERDLTILEVACQMKIAYGTVTGWLEKGQIPQQATAERLGEFVESVRIGIAKSRSEL